MRFLTVVTSVDVVHIAILRCEHAAPTTNYLAKLQCGIIMHNQNKLFTTELNGTNASLQFDGPTGTGSR